MTTAPPADLAPRTASFDADAFPMPTGREEEWRFAPIEALRPFLVTRADSGSVVAEIPEDSPHVRNAATGILDWWTPTNRPAAIAHGQASNVVTVFAIDAETDRLSFTGTSVDVPSPV